MTCPRCGAATSPGQKFCAECGLALATACPTCAAPYEPGQKFCAECGTALSGARPADARPAAVARSNSSAPAAAAERRFVSVLFADLVGFTTLSEQHDPEEVRELLSRYFDVARQVIEGYGGVVEKFIGDAVMAIWGAPVAREDDPERAVRAALDLVGRVRELTLGGQSLAIRAGVLSGEAAVTPGRVGEGMVAGDVVNTASRLQSVASADVVLVGESTMQATKASITYERAGDHTLKGKEAPVPAWRALRVVARVGGEGREEGLEPPFVGRDEEFRQLKDQLHAAERESKLRVVAVTAQAGLGKSRLVWEFEKYLDGLAADRIYYWHQGRSPSYGEGVTYWALGEMVRRRARIAEGEGADATREKLRATLADFVAEPDERQRLEPALGALLGIDSANWSDREQLFSAWRTFFERIADRGPTVLVFEDLQWADDGLLDFIDHLLDWTRDKPILIVTLARPEILDRRPNFGLGRHAFMSMHLDALADGAMERLLHGLVPSLSEDDLQRIVGRAEGVPLYAVETIRSLVDGGHLVRRGDVYEPVGTLPVLDIPPTLRALIASRLDALDAADTTLLRDAAVLGVVFATTALAAIASRPERDVEARLRALMTKELVVLEADPRSPERGQYRFTQALLREVAYAGLGRTDRRARHLAAARYLEARGDEQLAGVLATHYLEAYRASPDGDEAAAIAAQARIALKAAAERARQLHVHAQAVTYYEQALAVTFDPADQDDLRLRIARATSTLGDLEKAERFARAGSEANRSRGDVLAAAEADSLLAQVLLQQSRIDDAKQVLFDALKALPDAPSRVQAEVRGQLARTHLFVDEGEKALEQVDAALRIAEELGLRPETLDLLVTKAWALASVRRAREGTAVLLGAMAMADNEEDVDAASRARFNASGMIVWDDPHAALKFGREGMARDLELGRILGASAFAGNVSDALMILGRFEDILVVDSETTTLENPISITIHIDAAIVHALRGDETETANVRRLIDAVHAKSTSRQDVSSVGYFDAMTAYAAGHVAESRRIARETRDAYFGGTGPQLAVTAAYQSLLLGDIDGAREDRRWLADNRGMGRWFDRWQRAIDAAIATAEGRSAEGDVTLRALVDEWRAAELPLDVALATLLRSVVLGAEPEAAVARDEARQLFDELGVVGWFERLAAAADAANAPAKPAPRSPLEAGAAANL